MIGTTISHYKILEKLGEGGMGVVYKARDTKLDRLVALKFLPPHLSSDEKDKQRFIQEAKAASALDHPNICTIYEVDEAPDGQLFIAMAFYEGETLQQKIVNRQLSVDDCIHYAIQTAEGMQAAHKKSITHRDIKSSNIMVTPEGQVKIMDFGLAKTTGATMFTKTGATIGTVPYMSPEQARGEKVDHRTDIWSLGVVMYEMITRRLPFESPYNEAVVYSILNEQPKPFSLVRNDVPPESERIVQKCLAKNPSERFQRMSEVRDALRASQLRDVPGVTSPGFENSSRLYRPEASGAQIASPAEVLRREKPSDFRADLKKYWWVIALLMLSPGLWMILNGVIEGVRQEFRRGGTASSVDATPIRSIAVLPLKNVNTDPNVEYLSDGITENLINSLSQVSSLRVVPRSIVFSYKGKDQEAQRVGKELKAQAVLTGRVIQRGENLNVQAELIDVDKEAQLWGEQYNRKVTDIIGVQQEIAQQISQKLRLQLTGEEKKRLTKSYTENNDAYQLYLKGHYLVERGTAEALARGLELFNQAIKIDADFALPYAGVAEYYATGTDFYLAPKLGMPEVKKAAAKALEIDNEFSAAHTWTGFYDLWFSWKWSDARAQFQKAIELNPNEFAPHMLYSWYFLTQGQPSEAIGKAKHCMELEPLDLFVNATYGLVLYYSRRNDEAFDHLRKSLELERNFPFTRLYLGFCYLNKGEFKEAIAEFKKAHELFDSPWTLGKLAYGYARSGNKVEARKILKSLSEQSKEKYVASDIVASIYVALGEKDLAFEYLTRGFEERAGWMIWLNVDPVWDPLRSDPRFKDLLRRMNFPE